MAVERANESKLVEFGGERGHEPVQPFEQLRAPARGQGEGELQAEEASTRATQHSSGLTAVQTPEGRTCGELVVTLEARTKTALRHA